MYFKNICFTKTGDWTDRLCEKDAFRKRHYKVTTKN